MISFNLGTGKDYSMIGFEKLGEPLAFYHDVIEVFFDEKVRLAKPILGTTPKGLTLNFLYNDDTETDLLDPNLSCPDTLTDAEESSVSRARDKIEERILTLSKNDSQSVRLQFLRNFVIPDFKPNSEYYRHVVDSNGDRLLVIIWGIRNNEECLIPGTNPQSESVENKKNNDSIQPATDTVEEENFVNSPLNDQPEGEKVKNVKALSSGEESLVREHNNQKNNYSWLKWVLLAAVLILGLFFLSYLLKEPQQIIIADTDESTLVAGEDNATTDTDEDGISDADEVGILETNPLAQDSDGNGTPDGQEDFDSDGLVNSEELNTYHTDPKLVDTDQDGLNDADEVGILETNPLAQDSDGNGTPDGQEDFDSDGLVNSEELNTYHTDPKLVDTDQDGLNDGDEANIHKTDASEPDTDQDGLNDADEVGILETNPLAQDSDGNGTPDGQEDFDSDGLVNSEELNTYHTDPKLADTDQDGLNDADEVGILETNPLAQDSDGNGTPDGQEDFDSDGLVNSEELNTYHTDPKLADTDADGISDADEAVQKEINVPRSLIIVNNLDYVWKLAPGKQEMKVATNWTKASIPPPKESLNKPAENHYLLTVRNKKTGKLYFENHLIKWVYPPTE